MCGPCFEMETSLDAATFHMTKTRLQAAILCGAILVDLNPSEVLRTAAPPPEMGTQESQWFTLRNGNGEEMTSSVGVQWTMAGLIHIYSGRG